MNKKWDQLYLILSRKKTSEKEKWIHQTLPKKSPYSELFWSAFSPHFLAFGLNTERYGVSLRIKSECGKMRTAITPNTDTFYGVSFTYSLILSAHLQQAPPNFIRIKWAQRVLIWIIPVSSESVYLYNRAYFFYPSRWFQLRHKW